MRRPRSWKTPEALGTTSSVTLAKIECQRSKCMAGRKLGAKLDGPVALLEGGLEQPHVGQELAVSRTDDRRKRIQFTGPTHLAKRLLDPVHAGQ